MPRHDRFIARAMAVAGKSTYRWMVGCVVTEGSRVLGHSPNKFRNPPTIDPRNVSLHAEMATLARIAGGDTAYVARVDKHGNPRLARPCEACLTGLTDWGIRVIVFTNNNGEYVVEKIAA